MRSPWLARWTLTRKSFTRAPSSLPGTTSNRLFRIIPSPSNLFPKPQGQQDLSVELGAQQANLPLTYEGRLDVLAKLATFPKLFEISKPQLTNLMFQMPTEAAKETSTTTSSLVVVPAVWKYQSEPHQPQSGQWERTGFTANYQNGIIMAAAEEQNEWMALQRRPKYQW